MANNNIASQIEKIQKLNSTAATIEAEYVEVKETVSQLWKEYFPAAARKKELQAARKAIKIQLAKALEDMPELSALLNSIS